MFGHSRVQREEAEIQSHHLLGVLGDGGSGRLRSCEFREP